MGIHTLKTGIMGGTFDPPHYAHLILAEQAKEQFHLDRVLFMPNGSPPHKPLRTGRADNEQRLQMCALAVAGNPGLELCDLEMKSEGPSYSYLTLEKLHHIYPEDEFYFIIGADSLFDFPGWRQPQKICDQCILLCAVRNNCSEEEIQKGMETLKTAFGARIELIRTPNMDISSKMLRQMIHEGRSVRYYMPDDVIRYIAEQRIYSNLQIQ